MEDQLLQWHTGESVLQFQGQPDFRHLWIVLFSDVPSNFKELMYGSTSEWSFLAYATISRDHELVVKEFSIRIFIPGFPGSKEPSADGNATNCVPNCVPSYASGVSQCRKQTFRKIFPRLQLTCTTTPTLELSLSSFVSAESYLVTIEINIFPFIQSPNVPLPRLKTSLNEAGAACPLLRDVGMPDVDS